MCDSQVTVSFYGKGLRLNTSDDVANICDQIAGKDVEVIILEGNTIGIEAAERIGQELSLQKHLKEAYLGDLFTSRGRDEIPDALRHLLRGIQDSGSQLKVLDLSDNAIGPIGAPAVIDFLNSPSAEKIDKLIVNNCGWGPEGSTLLASTLARLKCLREFICGRSRLEDPGAASISKALYDIETLEVIKLNQNGIRAEGIAELSKMLMTKIDTIKEIDLSDNWLKTEGSEALAKFISSATELKKLILSDAFIGNAGFELICESLSISPSLKNLDEANFENNDLSGADIVEIIQTTFAPCKPDFALSLLDNDFEPDELTILEDTPREYTLYVDEADSDSDSD